MTAHRAADPDEVRSFVINAAANGTPNLAKALQTRFGVARSTAHNYLASFIDEGIIERAGLGQYELAHERHEFVHRVAGLEEHGVWSQEIYPLLADLPENVVDLWHYGCTEMINNVIDHSESEAMMIAVDRTAIDTNMDVHDQGVGIFRKIANALDLEDDRHAVLELSKGKLTTDPENHTGEGIYFSSRAFDDFRILSRGVFFTHEHEEHEDWILGREWSVEEDEPGTHVMMWLRNDSKATLKSIFDKYATDTEDYRFDRTVVPVRLLQYGDEKLVSRSQAKRLLNRFDRFTDIVLDFEHVESIGQAFADEVFRVFASRHPEIEVVTINANEEVSRMINRATRGRLAARPAGSA